MNPKHSDPVELLRSNNPVRNVDAYSNYDEIHLARIKERIRAEPAVPYSSDKNLRRANTFAARMSVAAASLIVAIAGYISIPGISAPASASELLETAASNSNSNMWNFNTLQTGEYGYQRVNRVQQFTNDIYTYSIAQEVDTYVNESGFSTIIEKSSSPEFRSAEDKSAWQRLGSPELAGSSPSPKVEKKEFRYQIGNSEIERSELLSLPSNNRDLAIYLKKVAPAQSVYNSAMQILTAPAVPKDIYVSLYRLLSSIPDLKYKTDGRYVQISKEGETATFSFEGSTGRIRNAENISANTLKVSIEKTGIINCVGSSDPDGPTTIYIGCATGSYMITDLTWKGWGTDSPTATGTASIRLCEPSCAEGRTNNYDVSVKLTRPESGGFGVTNFTRIEMYYQTPAEGLVNGGEGPDHIGNFDWWDVK